MAIEIVGLIDEGNIKVFWNLSPPIRSTSTGAVEARAFTTSFVNTSEPRDYKAWPYAAKAASAGNEYYPGFSAPTGIDSDGYRVVINLETLTG